MPTRKKTSVVRTTRPAMIHTPSQPKMGVIGRTGRETDRPVAGAGPEEASVVMARAPPLAVAVGAAAEDLAVEAGGVALGEGDLGQQVAGVDLERLVEGEAGVEALVDQLHVVVDLAGDVEEAGQ